ncbi:MAG: nickel pincer cofactor biosynthesis protein LarC [Eubacteriales bacterium]|nr:nickel pincer cofactor biosynthesis protein LarC [Eubacteriales bacterium]
MRTLYLECNMGAAGDMLSAALLELHPDPQAMVDRLNSLGIPDVVFVAEQMQKCGISGTHLKVSVSGVEEESTDGHPHDHSHGGTAQQHAYGPSEHTHSGEAHGHHDHVHEHDHHNGEAHTHGPHDHAHDHEHHGGEALEHVHDHDHHIGEAHGHGPHDHAHDHDHHSGEAHGHGHHHHVHRRLSDIAEIIGRLEIPETVRDNILAVYRLIAEAEGHAHNRPVEEVHFHEVGAMDAVADITAFCLLVHELAPERILASPVRTGFGEVRCAHGILPVPAPATAWILRGIPVYAGDIRGELCTPTGAALLKHFAGEYAPLPQMTVRRIGTGCGKKDFPQANCVRAFLGETPDSRETILELRCNLDDLSSEAVGFAMEELLSAGAVDVYTIPVTMKKSRPGFLLTCMCRESLRDEMLRLLFKHTTTLGIREYKCNRYTLERTVETIPVPEQDIRRKTAKGWGTRRWKYEYDDLAQLARAKDLSLSEAAAYADSFGKK